MNISSISFHLHYIIVYCTGNDNFNLANYAFKRFQKNYSVYISVLPLESSGELVWVCAV